MISFSRSHFQVNHVGGMYHFPGSGEPQKKTTLSLSMKSWLFNRDRYNGFWHNPQNCRVSSLAVLCPENHQGATLTTMPKPRFLWMVSEVCELLCLHPPQKRHPKSPKRKNKIIAVNHHVFQDFPPKKETVWEMLGNPTKTHHCTDSSPTQSLDTVYPASVAEWH